MPEQQSGQDNSLDLLWTIAIIVGLAAFSWYYWNVQISRAVFWLRWGEIKAITFVLDNLSWLGSQLFGSKAIAHPELDNWLYYIQTTMGSRVGFTQVKALSTEVGQYLRYPFGLIAIVGSLWLYLRGASFRFRHVYNTRSFRAAEVVNWPQIAPVVGLDLVNTSLDQQPWAMALSPMEFCKQNDLLDIVQDGGKYSAKLRRGAAYHLLSLQLGPLWRGIEYLPIHQRALFAIFASRINEDKKSAERLLDQISASAAKGKLDFSGVDQLLAKNLKSKRIAKLAGAHAYVTTLLASMLVGARDLGVLATAEFIWLKPLDRRLWYMLNSVGRQAAVTEICGAFAHWLAEKRLGLPLVVPMVDEGVRGLDLALSEMVYKPDEE